MTSIFSLCCGEGEEEHKFGTFVVRSKGSPDIYVRLGGLLLFVMSYRCCKWMCCATRDRRTPVFASYIGVFVV